MFLFFSSTELILRCRILNEAQNLVMKKKRTRFIGLLHHDNVSPSVSSILENLYMRENALELDTLPILSHEMSVMTGLLEMYLHPIANWQHSSLKDESTGKIWVRKNMLE